MLTTSVAFTGVRGPNELSYRAVALCHRSLNISLWLQFNEVALPLLHTQ